MYSIRMRVRREFVLPTFFIVRRLRTGNRNDFSRRGLSYTVFQRNSVIVKKGILYGAPSHTLDLCGSADFAIFRHGNVMGMTQRVARVRLLQLSHGALSHSACTCRRRRRDREGGDGLGSQ